MTYKFRKSQKYIYSVSEISQEMLPLVLFSFISRQNKMLSKLTFAQMFVRMNQFPILTVTTSFL